jgi:hypothetical protein
LLTYSILMFFDRMKAMLILLRVQEPKTRHKK